MARTANAVMKKRKMLTLSHFENLAESGIVPCSSYGELGKSLGLSNGQVRRICKLLQKEGALKVQPRYLKNGAQLENAYALTPIGRQRVNDWRAKGGSSASV